MPRERKPPLTLRERAVAASKKFNRHFRPHEIGLYGYGYLAGWHARGRAERVTKADYVWVVRRGWYAEAGIEGRSEVAAVVATKAEARMVPAAGAHFTEWKRHRVTRLRTGKALR